MTACSPTPLYKTDHESFSRRPDRADHAQFHSFDWYDAPRFGSMRRVAQRTLAVGQGALAQHRRHSHALGWLASWGCRNLSGGQGHLDAELGFFQWWLVLSVPSRFLCAGRYRWDEVAGVSTDCDWGKLNLRVQPVSPLPSVCVPRSGKGLRQRRFQGFWRRLRADSIRSCGSLSILVD